MSCFYIGNSFSAFHILKPGKPFLQVVVHKKMRVANLKKTHIPFLEYKSVSPYILIVLSENKNYFERHLDIVQVKPKNLFILL